MIDINKKYELRIEGERHPVRLLCTDRRDRNYPVVGLISFDGHFKETLCQWTDEGKASERSSCWDLVEVNHGMG